jgi:hypothetical protein
VRVIHALPVVPFILLGLLVADAIADNSFLWHIRAGQAQRTAGAVLTEDVFSFTEQGTVWRTQSWLAELLYHTLEGTSSSLSWANWLVFVVGATTLALIGIAVYHSVRSTVMTAVVLIVAVWLLGPFLQARPVVFSFLLLAALVVVLQHRERVVWAAVPLMWVWAGVHGSWVIGGLLILLTWLSTGDRQVFKAGVVSAVATLATAHGVGTWLVVSDFLGAQEALAQMQEWKPPDFGSLPQMPYLLLIAGVIWAAIKGRIKGRDLIVILPFMFLGMTSRRTVVPAAIVLIPWAAMALPEIRVPRSTTKPAIALAVVVLMAMFAVGPLLIGRDVGRLDAERFPSAEARAAIAGSNAFYDDGVGGYLIYREWPERLVWFDDRAELHGVDRSLEFQDAVAGRYRTVFTTYGFDAALSRPYWPLTDALIGDGWTIVHEDDHFVALVP